MFYKVTHPITKETVENLQEAPNGYSLRVVGVPQSRGTVQNVSTLSCLSGGPGPQFFWKPVKRPQSMAGGATAPYGRVQSRTKTNTKILVKTLLHTLTKNTLIHQSNPLNPHSPQPTHRLTHPHLSNPLCKTHPHTTEHLFNCTHLYTSSNILDLWMSPGRVVPLLARWKERLAGLP